MTMAAGLPPPPAVAHLAVHRAVDANFVAIFVEGSDDVDTWRPWLKWRPFPAGGCIAVLAAIRELRAANASGFVGIIDANCQRLEGNHHAAADLLVTAGHDLECDLLQLPALDRMLETVNEVSLATLLGTQPFRDALLERATHFGLLRWHFFRRRMPYPHGRLSPNNFVDSGWKLNETALASEAAAALGDSVQQVNADIATLRARNHPAWHVCNGHDLIAILALALRGALGAARKYPQSDAVSAAFRLAVDSRDLQNLPLWQALKNWEQANSPFVACAF